MNQKPIILIDAECLLCSKAKAFIDKHTQGERFVFYSLFSEEGKKILKETDLPEHYTDSLVLVQKGQASIRSDAALLIAKELNGLYSWLYYLKIVPRFLRDMVYNLVAKHRHKIFGRK